MTDHEFLDQCDFLCHLAYASVWESVKLYGLLSTSALLKLFQVGDGEVCVIGDSGDWQFIRREEMERTYRRSPVTIKHPEHGTAVLRDHRPLQERNLRLDEGLLFHDWIAILNSMAFFWPNRERMKPMKESYGSSAESVGQNG